MDIHNGTLIQTLEASDDVGAWINDQLHAEVNSAADLVELDKRVGDLATRLEIIYQGIANDLEHTLESTSRTIPRLTFDLQFMRESALNLRADLQKTQKIRAAGGGTSDIDIDSTLDQLRELDLIKRNMQDVQHLLRETENWNTLENEVTNYIHIGDLPCFQKAADRVKDASQGLALYQGTTEFEAKKALVTSLENQLEAKLSSGLVAAANSNDLMACKDYYNIFKHINRELEFRSYYNGARRNDIVSAWNNTIIRDCGEIQKEGNEVDDFNPFLRHLLTDIDSLIDEERKTQPTIFPKPLESLTSLIQSVFDAFSPSLSQRLKQYTSHNGARCLPGLIDCQHSIHRFIASVSKVIQKLSFLSALASEESVDEIENVRPSKTRRPSKRLSISRRTFSTTISGFSQGRTLSWELVLLEPLLDYQSDYARLEKMYLTSLLFRDDGLRRQKRLDTDDEREFRENAIDVFSAANDAIGRCMSFTSGYGGVGLIETLEYTLTIFLKNATETFSLLKSAEKANQVNWKAAPEYDDVEYSDQDWSTIQTCLRLLEASKNVYDRMGALDSKILRSLTLASQTIRGPVDTRRALDETEPGIQLLAQSPLNSLELQNLFDVVENDDPSSRQGLALLKQSYIAVVSFTRNIQGLLSRTILGPLAVHLQAYPYLDAWTALADPNDRQQVLSFSMSPTANIQRVAEGLLNLPRLFEAHVDDESLAFFIELLPFVTSELEASRPTKSDQQAQLEPEQITAAWLSSLTMSLLNTLINERLPQLRILTAKGVEQLAADLDYLGNIVQALNVESRELELWKEYIHLEDGSARLPGEQAEKADEIFRHVARLRGWS